MHAYAAAHLPAEVEHVIASGVGADHLERVVAAYAEAGLVPVAERSGGGWSAVVLERR